MRAVHLTIPLCLAAFVLLGREAVADAWALPAAARLALIVGLAASMLLLGRRQPALRLRGALPALVLLMLAAAVRFWPAQPTPDAWREQEEARLRQRRATVQARVQALEASAHRLAGLAAATMGDSLRAASAPPEARGALFDALAGLVQREVQGHPDLENAGVQLFDARGDLLAWAGAPHARDAGTRLTQLTDRRSPLYFRQSGVYTLLTFERPDSIAARPDSAAEEGPATSRPRVLVDVPVEVQYQLNNRFLQSRSLPRELSGDGLEVELVYAAASVPAYLMQTDLEVLGGPEQGLQGESLLRNATGVPLVICRLTSLPYADSVERATARLRTAQRWLLVLAAAAGGLALLAGLRAAPPGRLRRFAAGPVVPILLLWGLRLLPARLGLPGSGAGDSLLNPASFAMLGFGGIVRSPMDLLLTALTLAGSAAILFLHAVRQRGTALAAARPRPGAGLQVAGAVVLAALVSLLVERAVGFVTRVAGDSNPILVGPELDLLSPAALCLHLALLLGVAAWLGLALLAVHALRGGGLGRLALAAAAGLVLAALLPRTGLVVALVGAALLVCGARLRVLLADERFTSFALAGFLLAALAATLNSEAIHREYFREKQVLAQERAAEILAPDDDLRRFVLEEVLGKLGRDASLQRGLLSERESERSALAFRVWAQSMLSHLGYSCQVRVYDAFGTPASEFAVDMPLGRDVSARDLIERARVEPAPITRTDVEASTSGRVRLYSGAVSIAPGGEGREPLGWIVIDLPFAHASLDLAANPRARTPEVLRNLQEEGIGPRIEDSERLLLAWLEGGYVVESSTPYLEVGQALHGSVGDGAWHELHLVNGDYLVQHVQAGERVLLAGFRLATPVDRLLEWTQVGSFSFATVFGVLLAFFVVTRGLGLTGRLPRLLVPKRLGFQQKLMMAFLIVSLLPSVVLSLATRDIMRDRSLRRNRDAALAKARSAEAALADLVRRDLDAVRESEYLRAVLTAPEQPPARDIGHLEFSQIMVFRDDGGIILDETLSNLSDEEARSFVAGAPHEVFASRDGRHLYLGVLVRVWYSPTEILSESAPDAQPYYLFYRRRLTDKLLRNLAPILNADISGFLGAQLAVSSQKSLATAGLMPSLVPPEAFAHVQVRRNRYAVVEERTGRQRYFTGYLPLEDGRGRRIGSLAVSQLLQPDEFAIEVERTRGLVLGLSTLMFVLTLLLGVVFAARIFDPVRSLIEGTRRIAGGDLAFRLRARGGDEIGELERSFNDMAARLQAARRALEERRRYLEAVLGHIASGVIATDAHGRITAANPAAYRILQMPHGGLEGRAWNEPGLGAAGMAHFWSRLAEAPDGEVVEIPLVLRGGGALGPADGGAGPASERLTLRVVVTDLLPPGAAAGEPWGRVAIFEDVTELIRSKKLSAWAEMARQVAHEIKNPLTPMKLSAQFVQQAYEDQSAKFPQIFHEGMATIIAQVESLRRIATEFANFGRVQKLEPRPLDLGTLLRRVTAPYGRIEGLHLEVLDGADGAAPSGDRFPGDGVLVLGDEDGLRRVFSNVLENAREAMGGRGHIALRVLPPSGGRVQVRIDDHGSGLSQEAAARLFEPYFSTKTTGTGLGLAITKGILEELGGSIALTNRAGGGVETRITLVVC